MTKVDDLILENQQRILLALSVLLEDRDEEISRLLLSAAEITSLARKEWETLADVQ